MESEQLNPLVARKTIHGANLTIARLEIRKGAVVPEHSHINEQVAMVETGAITRDEADQAKLHAAAHHGY